VKQSNPKTNPKARCGIGKQSKSNPLARKPIQKQSGSCESNPKTILQKLKQEPAGDS
jgi:hypothetical protein